MNIDGIKNAADCVFLSQICYWAEKMNFKEFYKTNEEIAKETRLPIWVIKNSKERLKLVAFLTISSKGLPRKTYYHIDGNKMNQQVGVNDSNQLAEKTPTSRRESGQIYIEQKNTTEDYNKEREEARARTSSPVLSPSLSFLDRFYSEWENCTGKVERQARITKWFNVSSDGDKELAISNVARYVKAAKDLGKSLKHPYFFLEDRDFSKAYVVDKPLALKETPTTQSIILNNNHSPEIQKQLIEELGEPVYKSWFEQCQIVQSGCDIEVTAPNNFVKETVEELLGQSRFRRSYDSIKVMIAEFICVLAEYLEPIEQYYCV